MNSRRRNSLAASPLLIGAVTTLIVSVAVFLAYNANNGLPFTPTYNIKVALPDASNLQPTNEVRIGGARVGVVDSITPKQDPRTGRVTAIASLKLIKSVQPLAADSTSLVQSRSALGLKYLELDKGASRQSIKPGGTLALAQARSPVDIDEFFNMFDEKTRTANQQNLINFGNGFAGRGIGLNDTIATLRPLVNAATPALRNLAAPKTGLRELFAALDRPASEAAPVAALQGQFFSDLDTFFTAWAGAAPQLSQTIEGGPAALEQATRSLPFEAAFVNKSATFMRLLRPSASALRTAAAPLGHAFAVGAVNLQAATAFNTRLATSLQTLKTFANNPVVALGLDDVAQTTRVGNPLVAGLAPIQLTCNYLTLSFRNAASLLSENIGVGTLGRALPILAPGGANNEGFPSSAPANGPSIDKTFTGQLIDDNHLHANPYPNVAGPGQPKECEAGNQTYAAGKTVIGTVPNNVGTVHDVTKRSQDLFGQTYPSAALKDLGQTTTKKQAAATSSKSKGKQG
ncbi:MAG TPA: MlaD family protein [Solirubrobacteraceae bacterium]|nr:MlaD family protein [Solirubrobacteraceae bacterium]